MISVIVPVYNAELYLDECLSSICRQSYKDFEVICINDGSQDESMQICVDWATKDQRFKVFSQENSGVSAARNKGLYYAKGEFVCFVDSDDYVHEDYLYRLYSAVQDKGVAVCDWTRGDGIGDVGGNKVYSVEEFIDAIVFEKIKHPNIPCFLFRKEVITCNGLRFSVGCTKNEDYEFYMSYLACCEMMVSFSGYVGYYYRSNEFSAMSAPLTYSSLTSIEASKRIDNILTQRGYFKSAGTVLANGILTYTYLTAHKRKYDLYFDIHKRYNVNNAMKKMLSFPVFKKRLVAFVYLLLGKNNFYKLVRW